MKDIGIGCIGALLGFAGGILLTFSVMTLLPKENPPATAAPFASGSRSDVSVTASASYLNAQLQQAVRQSGLAKQATLTLVAPNVVRVVVAADTNVLGKTVTANVTVTIRVAARNGRIVLTVDRVDTGGVNVPSALSAQSVESIRAQVEDQLNRTMQRTMQGTALRLINIGVTPDSVTLEFKSGS